MMVFSAQCFLIWSLIGICLLFPLEEEAPPPPKKATPAKATPAKKAAPAEESSDEDEDDDGMKTLAKNSMFNLFSFWRADIDS